MVQYVSISHVAGKDLDIAETLSRAPVENMSQSDTDFENETKAFVDVVISNLPAFNYALMTVVNTVQNFILQRMRDYYSCTFEQ
jgi:hypothetical protein